MEFLLPSSLFFLHALYLLIKPNKPSSKRAQEEAEAYFFNKSEVTEDRTMTGLRTSGIGFYKDKTGKIKAVKQSKLCDIELFTLK